MNVIYSFDVDVGTKKLNEIISDYKNIGIELKSEEYDDIDFYKKIVFDNGDEWFLYKPYRYKAELKERWDRCLFDNQSINNTSSNAFNLIAHNNKVGSKIEYFN